MIEHKGPGYTKYFVPSEAIALTDTMQTFTYIFTMDHATDAGAHLVFLLGLINGNSEETNAAINGTGNHIYIDDVSLVEEK
ncbi:hypothetical protein D3C75_1301040 [compost metagenome]